VLLIKRIEKYRKNPVDHGNQRIKKRDTPIFGDIQYEPVTTIRLDDKTQKLRP